ncbi:ABC transporter substrate-binding protein [Egicoccus sp. AB-alg2]|uniref:ABC transporter substrate-binding protein n=1 Tax=Egicoccus sp. AB-alg2 TaxID=3242693 RepID=UPI00359D2BCD
MGWREATAGVLGTALLFGCSGGGEVTPSDATAESTALQGGTPDGPLRVVGPFELHSIDPSTAGGFFTRLEVAETLVEADTQGELQPGLATEWEVESDGLSWRFALREDAVFHDGTAVEAPAVAAALDHVRAKPDSPLSAVPVDAVTADDDAVVVTLTEPFAPLPAVLAHTSTQILAPASYDSGGEVTSIIGTGPYEVATIRQPDRIEVVASDIWTGTPPAIEEIHYEAVGRAERRALMAESGQAHVTFGMDPVSRQRIGEDADVELVSVTLPRTIQFKLDAAHPFLDDVEVRQALSLALDRTGMATALLRDPEMAATQLFPPTLEEWHQDGLAAFEHDPSRARQLLAELGWQPGPDGTLVRDGERFELTLRTFTDRPELPPLATAIQAALAEIGIDLEVSIGNSSDIPAGHQDGSLELGLYARNFALVPDPLVTLIDDFGPEGADWGAMNWSDEQLTETLTAMAADADVASQPQRRGEVAQILHDELPVVPVAWYRQSAVVDQRLDGFELDPLERNWLLSQLRWRD